MHHLKPKDDASPAGVGEEEKEKKPKNKLIQKEKSNLFVGNLPKNTDDAGLRKLFAGFEKIQSAVVKRDDQGNLTDNGFVNFETVEQAKAAKKALNKMPLENGSFLLVNYFVTKKENENYKQRPIAQNLQETYSSNIYVRNIPAGVTEEQLKQTFSSFDYFSIEVGADGNRKTEKKKPTIVSIKMGKEGGKETQFAYILYQTVGASQRAI